MLEKGRKVLVFFFADADTIGFDLSLLCISLAALGYDHCEKLLALLGLLGADFLLGFKLDGHLCHLSSGTIQLGEAVAKLVCSFQALSASNVADSCSPSPARGNSLV